MGEFVNLLASELRTEVHYHFASLINISDRILMQQPKRDSSLKQVRNRQHGAMEFTKPPAGLDKVRRYRVQRVRDELQKHDLAGILVFDQLNTRYVTDATNMQIWCSHYEARCAFVATEGPVILWDFGNMPHLAEDLPTVDEYRVITPFYFFSAGSRAEENARKFAREILDLVQTYGGGNRRLAIDRCSYLGLNALMAAGLDIEEGQDIMEVARLVKSEEELELMRYSVKVCELAVDHMRQFMVPGITENALWSKLHEKNIELGGEWIETRLLSSGWRTNPWMRESSMRVIERGDMVSFDTDLIGPYGYCCDMSRSWICGEDKPSAEQARLYQLSAEQIRYNTELVKPGVTFKELGQNAWPVPEEFVDRRYGVIFHGVGLADEYPSIKHYIDYEQKGYEGVLEPGMTLCVESYIGSIHGGEGVKIEEQLLVTETGYEMLTTYPLEDW